MKVNVNISDQVGLSITNLNKNSDLKGNWMPDNFWWSLNYRGKFLIFKISFEHNLICL